MTSLVAASNSSPRSENASQWQWLPRVLLPTLAKIFDQIQAFFLPRKASLMNADAKIRFALLQLRNDVRKNTMLDASRVWIKELEQQGGCRVPARAKRSLRLVLRLVAGA